MPLRLAKDRRHPRLDQLGGIGTALVAQRVEAGGDEQGRRQARGGEVDRRCAVIRGVGGILVAEPFHPALRSEEHTSELQSLMRISYAVFCLQKTKQTHHTKTQSL